MSNPYFSSYSRLPRDQLARAEDLNAIFDAIIVGFDGIPSSVALTQDRLTYSVDSGSANAYVLAPSVASASYIAGSRYSFIAANTNTGASTVNVSGLGVKALHRANGDELSANDILAGALVWVQYDGTEFQLMSFASSDFVASAAASIAAAASELAAAGSASAAAASAGAASGSATAAAGSASASAASAATANTAASVLTAAGTTAQWAVATGLVNALVGAFPTAVASLTDGLVLAFRANLTNTTTTPTFKADGTTAHTITREGGLALQVGDIIATGEYQVRYNLANTRWELLNPRMGVPLNRAQLAATTRTGLTSSTGAMLGFALALTPRFSGRFRITVVSFINPSNTSDNIVGINYGTGSAPANGDAAAGTQAITGGCITVSTVPSVRANASFTVEVSGLTLGTAYWFDMAYAVTAGATIAISAQQIIVQEIP